MFQSMFSMSQKRPPKKAFFKNKKRSTKYVMHVVDIELSSLSLEVILQYLFFKLFKNIE